MKYKCLSYCACISFILSIIGIASYFSLRHKAKSNGDDDFFDPCFRTIDNIENDFYDWFDIFNTENSTLDNYHYNDWYICKINMNNNIPYNLSHNQFSGWNISQWNKFLTAYLDPKGDTNNAITPPSDNNLRQNSIDWSSKLGPVKDQGSCGCCYAMTATELMEYYYTLNTKTIVELSVQQIIDCDKIDFGCDGGAVDDALIYIQNNKGLCSEKSYPFASSMAGMQPFDGITNDKCKKCNPISNTIPATINSYYNATDMDLITNLNYGPVGVYIDASTTDFQFYSVGVLDTICSPDTVDHAVLAVGYDSNSFKIKNSWSSSWGESGYARIKRKSKCVVSAYQFIVGGAEPTIKPTNKPTIKPTMKPTTTRTTAYPTLSYAHLDDYYYYSDDSSPTPKPKSFFSWNLDPAIYSHTT